MNMKVYRNIVNFLLLAGLSLAFLACEQEPTVTSVTVSPPSPSVAKGGIQQFSPKVEGTNNPAQSVTWSIEETNKNSDTTINSGLLTVAVAETLKTLTVRATSTLDPSKSGTANVTIDGTATVISVTVDPANPSVLKGKTQNFTAKVTGDKNPMQTVTWSVTGGITGTSIASNGILTIASGETTGKTLTVTATSTLDLSKSGTATVTVKDIPTTPLDKNAAGVQTFTSNSNGNKSLSGSPYGYEMWTQGGNNNKLIWFGPNQGGGAAFRAEWNNPNDFLGRVGYYWNQGKPYTDYKNVYCDFAFTRSANGTAGGYSYIGIYGWSKNPMIEWYIVDDWFGSGIMGPSTMGGGATKKGEFVVDGETYFIYQATRPAGSGNIEGSNVSFPQFFSIRQTRRQIGTISVTEHFKKWDALGMKLGSNMYECKFLVEAGGGTGWLELTWLEFTQEG